MQAWRVALFSSTFQALFTASKAVWALSASSVFLSGCTRMDILRNFFLTSSRGRSGST